MSVMKDSVFQRLLRRAEIAGVDTVGYTAEISSFRRLEARVDEKEAQRASKAAQAPMAGRGRVALASPPEGSTAAQAVAVASLLRHHGLPVDDNHREQMEFFVECLKVFSEREETYQGLWKSSGAYDNAHHLFSKAQRAKLLLSPTALRPEQKEAVQDDLRDAANYAAFAARNTAASRIEDQEIPG